MAYRISAHNKKYLGKIISGVFFVNIGKILQKIAKYGRKQLIVSRIYIIVL